MKRNKLGRRLLLSRCVVTLIVLLVAACGGESTKTTMPGEAGVRAEGDTDEVAAVMPFDDEIRAFEALDAQEKPPKGAIVFVGSSSIRLWTTLAEDVAPVPVIRRGFGGASLADCIRYVDRVVTNYQPKAVFVFCGSNDIAGETPKSADEVLALYQQYVGRIQSKLPGVPVHFISISPTKSRWELVAVVRQANELIEDWSATRSDLFYIDTAPALLDESGEPRDELFRADQLHLSEAGYEVWTGIIRPQVEKAYFGK